MLEPYATAADVPAASEARADIAGFIRQRVPEKCHPLTRIDRIVERVCTRTPVEGATRASVVDPRLVRAAILQSLYSFNCNELLLEQLRYNTLYRWFVGLQDGHTPWSAASYAEALSRLLSSAQGAAVLRTALILTQSCIALTPDRFRIDRGLMDRWISTGTEAVKVRQADSGTNDELCRARLDRARDIILRRIGDSDLTPESIAAEMCMSRRALYLLFEKNGLTPTSVIRDLRLDHCRNLLTDARHRHRKITDIAMDFGFSHAGTFSRQFKERFGVSPIEVRFRDKPAQRDVHVPRYARFSGGAHSLS